MRDRQTCIDCAKLSPETDTNYTLISAQFGWRLTRKRLPDGTFVVEWRCPECWKLYKSSRTANEPLTAWPHAHPESGRGSSPPSRPLQGRAAPPLPPPQPPPLPSRYSSRPPNSQDTRGLPDLRPRSQPPPPPSTRTPSRFPPKPSR